MDKEKVRTLKKFVNDQDWKEMEDYIMSFLDVNIDIRTIDTSKDASVIAGEVMARKVMADKALRLIEAFKGIRDFDPDKPVEKKKPLK